MVMDVSEAPGDVIDRVVSIAHDVHERRELQSREVRIELLRGWADRLDAHSADLVEIVGEETALPPERVVGELVRTTGQLRLFADVVEEGSWVEARIDIGPPDLRRMLVPIGPVGVFGASNFPLAFSTPGGDTASAIAAGCPVIVKTHPAHPLTCALTGGLLDGLVADLDLPAGIFQQVGGAIEMGVQLVKHPKTAAIAFTGSLGAGRALFDIASARPNPIPVYAEMASINPLFVLPQADRERGSEIAADLADSVTAGVGQFCTKPGVVIGIDIAAFAESLGSALASKPDGVMLTQAIGKRYELGIGSILRLDGVDRISGDAVAGGPVCVMVDAGQFVKSSVLREEIFGPYTIVVSCENEHEMLSVASAFDGQLTASIHASSGDMPLAAQLVDVMAERVGRIVWNGFPTGVTVSHAMQHGGPYPASSDSRSTSVGSASIGRFARPVAFQDVPSELLPDELRDANDLGIWRMIGADRTTDPVC